MIEGSSWRREPAAAFRGLANTGSPAFLRDSFSASKSLFSMKTSPRTAIRWGTGPPPRGGNKSQGIARMVFTFAVTVSPSNPSPRVPAPVSAPAT